MSSSYVDDFQSGPRGGSGNPGTWNPGSDGNSWSSQGGNYTLGLTGTSPNVFGTLTGLTTRVTEYYSSASQADGVMSVKFKVSNSSDGCGLVFRGDGSNANQYRCFYRGGNSTLEIAKVVGSTVTTLVSTSFTATANTLYDIKCSFIGNTLQGKIWADGSGEPSYQISATDATYSNGQFGLQIAAGVNTDTVSVQYFSLSTSVTRVVIATTALLATRTRTLSPTTTALQLTKTRTISATVALLGTVPGTPYATTTLSTAPVAYYRLGESSGTTAFDQTANAYNGVISATGVTLGQAGALAGDSNTAMLFDGLSGHITLPSGLDPAGWTALTLAWWQNLTATGDYPSPWSNAQADVSHTGFHCYIESGTQQVNLVVGTGTSSFGIAFGTGADQIITLSTWQHIVVTLTTTTATLYINGTLVRSVPVSTFTSFVSSANPVSIGWIQASTADFVTGNLDEMAIYNTALSSAQVLTLYMAGAATYIPATAALQFLAGTRGISATAAFQFVFARTLPASGALLATASRTMSATVALSAQHTIPADSALSLADETRAIPASASLALYIALFPQTSRRTGLFPASARRGTAS